MLTVNKVSTSFSKHLSTLVKNIFWAIMAPFPSCQTRLVETRLYEKKHTQQSIGYRLYIEGRLASDSCIIDNTHGTVLSF